ncbi:MAG: hypothetical protein BWY58_01007 [Chloroflexi bacterium ADurb.Bin344]|nr:MAG: hypothetical protein BWY58_01007 [Chloroflexi bacterium ADurb.Bin344]
MHHIFLYSCSSLYRFCRLHRLPLCVFSSPYDRRYFRMLLPTYLFRFVKLQPLFLYTSQQNPLQSHPERHKHPMVCLRESLRFPPDRYNRENRSRDFEHCLNPTSIQAAVHISHRHIAVDFEQFFRRKVPFHIPAN